MRAASMIVLNIALVVSMTTYAKHFNTHTGEPEIGRNVERTTKAVDYRQRHGLTMVDVRGTSLLPKAGGQARIESKLNHVTIEAEFNGLPDATRFGPEYLTYVMWGIPPEGCAVNLGEVALKNARSTLKVATELDVFGLIVTAEPYFAVSQPSDVVVIESVFRKRWFRKLPEIDARYELLPRGNYTIDVSPSDVKPIIIDRNTPLVLYEARNAFWIALWAGAGKDAAELFDQARRSLEKAEGSHAVQAGNSRVLMEARETVIYAENARQTALRHRPPISSKPDTHSNRCRSGVQ